MLFLHRALDDGLLKSVLTLRRKGKFPDEELEILLRLIRASGDRHPGLFGKISADAVVQKFLRLYASDGLDDDVSKAALNFICDPINETNTLRFMHYALDEGTLKDLVTLRRGGRLPDGDMEVVLQLLRAPKDGQPRLLDKVATDAALQRLLGLNNEGKLDAETVLTHKALEHLLEQHENGRLSGEFDAQRLDAALKLFTSATIMDDGFASLANATWLTDDRFKNAYKSACEIAGWTDDRRWRVYTLLDCAQRAKELEGDFVECGVGRGGTAMGVIEYIGRDAFADRLFYLFDTFEGVAPEPMTNVETGPSKDSDTHDQDIYEDVANAYKDLPFAKIVRGRVAETLGEFKPGPVAYLHIEMNDTMPECAALEFYWPHLVKGAPVIFDGYGLPAHSEKKTDLDAVAAKLGSHIMMLPTGQGLMWKT